ncbi:potassium/proton antiporter [Flammeovirga sp. SubArs3]|uniref:potassium/proton antiporter n=1 Tax=Flammeovirga sp. SubArs3 TaxID=2995316 RepID=UPI00248CBF0E|nr:potassium/proton antiporter [Flammeovirga sp. SubArs3]
MSVEFFVLTFAVLIVIGILLYNPGKNFGIPAAIIFIGVALFIGNDQEFLFVYNNPNFTDIVSQLSLVTIIFVGGLHTEFKSIKGVMKEATLLSNLGVLVTTVALGVFVSYVTPLSITEGLLLAAIVSSTDSAAVFAVLESKNLKLKYGSDKVLEFESATNDPMAMILTLIFISILENPGELNYGEYILFFVKQIAIGLSVAFILYHFVKFIFKNLKFKEEGLIPIFLLALLVMIIELNSILGGNPLISAYLLGLSINTLQFQNKDTTLHFYNSLAWLAQSVMFLILGLELFPDKLLAAVPNAILPTLFLFFIARPAGVFISYLFIKTPVQKKVFVSWCGLKGATPIVFALMPLLHNLENAEMIFYIVSFMVLVSLIVHPLTLKPLAKKLNITE